MVKKKPGRPPLAEPRVGFTLKIRETLLRRLREFVYRKRTVHNVVIEQAIEEFLDKHEKLPSR